MEFSKRAALGLLSVGATSSLLSSLGRTRAAAQISASSTTDIPQDVLELIDTGENNALRPTLARTIEFGSVTYYIVEVQDSTTGIGEPVVVRKPVAGEPVVLSDFLGIPQLVSARSAGLSGPDIDVSGFALDAPDVATNIVPGVSSRAATDVLDADLTAAAIDNVGLDSSKAAGTNGGRLACAWAVNRVVESALRRPVAKTLSTYGLDEVLRARHVRIKDPVPGCIVISPTSTVRSPKTGRVVHAVGHVGIVGRDRAVYSNSSSRLEWIQNFTVGSWNDYFGGRGLPVRYYRLDDIYFPK